MHELFESEIQKQYYNSRFVSYLAAAAAAQVMDNAMLIESVNIGIPLLSLRLVIVQQRFKLNR